MRTSEDSVSQVMSDAFMKNLDLCSGNGKKSFMNQLIGEMPVAIAGEDSFSADELYKIDAYWRACNYLCLGMIKRNRFFTFLD